MNESRYLKGLNEAQKQAVLHEQGPLLIVAGAGTGKTRTITHRIAHLISSGVNPRQILAVTFTNKAAGEMQERIVRLLQESGHRGETPTITTFHGLGARLLREFADEAGVPKSFSIWDRDDQVRALKQAIKQGGWENRFQPRTVLATISRAKGDGTTLAAYTEAASSFYEESVARLWHAYDEARTAEGALDFSDLLLQTVILLKNRPDVLGRLQKRWTHLTIDEYQDTNRAQFDIARLLAGDAHNICVVGDLDQCVYSWNGADIANLLTFEKHFPNTVTIPLEQNYRSTQTIITAANAVIEKNKNRIPKRLFTDNPTGEAIRLFAGETERDEAFFVARESRSLLNSGVRASEIAVLFRENFQSRSLEEACIAEGVPYRVLGVRFFDRLEVKDILAYLRAARNPRAQTDFARAAGAPTRGIGKQTLEKYFSGGEAALTGAARTKIGAFRALLEKIRVSTETQQASAVVRFAITESGYETFLSAGGEEERDRLNNAYELVAHAARYDTLPAPEGIERLLEDAALMSDQDALQEKKEAVSLMTMHASKGLEFDCVFVTGLEEGLFPSHREDDRDPEEERRLFYVALTRARKHLYLTLAASRARYGVRDRAFVSSFLDDIDSRLIQYADIPAAEPTIYL
ncbi:MAG TPA: UvrD-helicase domain-containing protein [Candidatus Paceibacterota bacterium]|nr:UvrD-helicase domain-containing protein [Candidatus Paceibacterota bacterium]